jgi:hypothetical protein
MKIARTFRLFAHLCLATACGAAPLTAGMLLGACADDSDPQTWVKRLDDPAQRPAAIRRLSQFFEDAMTKANKNRDDPQVKTLLDEIVDPMSKQYTAGNLDEKTRKDLIKFIADTRDPRTAPALAKAFNEYEPGKSDEDVKFAAQSVRGQAEANKLTDQSVIDALWNCFDKFHASKTNMSNLVRDLHDAVLAVKSPSYGPKAVGKLGAAIADPKSQAEGLDQIQFWQMTSVQLIGALKFTPGIKPLVTVLLTPTKSDLRATVNTALMRMPKEAEPVLISALKGTDPDFAKLAAAPEFQDKSNIAVLADSISWLSRPDGKNALLDALAAADNDQNRTVIALSLIHYPPEPKLVKAFLDAYNKVPASAVLPLFRGANGHGLLTQASSQFYQPNLTDWLVKEVTTAKGEAADEMQLFALEAAVKLMTSLQFGEVNDAIKKEGTPREQEMYKFASGVVSKCGQGADCYLKTLDDPIPSNPPTASYAAVKAAWMCVVYGGGANAATIRGGLVDKLSKIRGGARLAVAEAIDALAPQGDTAAADKLDKLVDADKASGNTDGDDAVVKVSLRLRSRALP